MADSSPRHSDHPALAYGVLVAAIIMAFASARDYAGGWNDGSRLATVECLIDHHTLVIDNSIFVRVPRGQQAIAPYPADNLTLIRAGTADKLFIHGHYYSDKSPVPALLLAGAYQGLQWCTGLKASEQPKLFCYWMTLISSGLAYVLAVGCVDKLGRVLRLALSLRLLLTASFGLATVAPVYSRHVNNHILLLAVTSAVMLNLTALPDARLQGKITWKNVAALGTLAGLGYTIDLGAGPVLLACLLPLLAWRCRSFRAVGIFMLAALPWLALHHAVNYAVGGTIKPANAVPVYFQWPGCPFTPANLTGTWKHSPGHFVVYGLALLGGKRGFFGHNLPLFLALPGVVILLRRRLPELAGSLFCCFFCGGTWLGYALTSNNYAGQCCSIRWFVPLLAPGYYVLAVLLKRYPSYRWDMLILTSWGLVLAGFMWRQGPWMTHAASLFWPLQGGALMSWLAFQACRRRQSLAPDELGAGTVRRRINAA